MKFRQIREFIRTGIWDADLSAYSKFKARVTRHLKVFIITLRTFSNKQVGYRAVALAFFTTIALVPCIALAFAITNGFGIDDDLAKLLLLNYSAQEEIIKTVLQYADNVIGATQRGGFGIVSFLCFIWLVFWLMIQVESNFNYVWGVRVGKTRKIWKRLGAYFMIIILLPFVIIMFLATSLQFSQGNGLMNLLINIPFWDKISDGVRWLLTYGITALVLTLMYKFIPTPKVKFSNAWHSALLTAVLFCIFQWIYVETQIFFNRLNGVFGAVAAIPFLMIWLNVSWFIVLFGNELTYAFHNVETYNPLTEE
ncbi:MAG: YihY/virulence factor BrkB family protein [Bacteroidetes bacterium]|nr:YihY/virulence factor BrkB family protein [Candidatus Colenecus caballi]